MRLNCRHSISIVKRVFIQVFNAVALVLMQPFIKAVQLCHFLQQSSLYLSLKDSGTLFLRSRRAIFSRDPSCSRAANSSDISLHTELLLENTVSVTEHSGTGHSVTEHSVTGHSGTGHSVTGHSLNRETVHYEHHRTAFSAFKTMENTFPRHAFRRMSGFIDIALVIALLLGTNILAHITNTWASIGAVPFSALMMLLLMRHRGIGFRELGLSPESWKKGLLYSLVIIVIVAVGIGIGITLPLTRHFFINERYSDIHTALVASLVIIPLITVIPEELVFRGILQGTLTRLCGKRGIFIIGSVLFGLWHILSSLGLSGSLRNIGGVFGGGIIAQVGCIILAVIATSGAGCVFIWLRRKSGSLLAPIALHWALNGAGALAAALVWQGVWS